MYGSVKPEDAGRIIDSLDKEPVKELKCDLRDYFDDQVHVVLENSGHIDPEKIDEYIAADGYKALLKALTEMNPSAVVDQISKSGLRGRGGGGYPTGLKWSTVAKAVGEHEVCDLQCATKAIPGAFMDRSVLESDPQRVIEGMTIAAYAVGASRGYFYVRAEYPLAIAAADDSNSRGTPPRLPGQQYRRH